MSKEILILNNTSVVRKYFPNPQTGVVRTISAVATTYDATTPDKNKQTDATGIVELTLTVPLTASLTSVRVAFDASSNAVAKAWLDDTTVDADGIQYRTIVPGTTRTFHFSSPITRWDMLAIGAATIVYQEGAR